MAVDVGSAKGYLDLDISGFLSGLKTAQSEADATTKNIAAKAGENLKSLGKGITSAGTTLTKTVTVPIVGAGAAIVKMSSNFETAMSKVQAISGASGDDLVKLTDKAKELGASTVFSASQVAEGMTEMAKAGWTSEQIIAGMEGVLNAASASGENLAAVSTIVADAITGFGLEAKDATRLADLLTQAANSGTIDINDLGESFKYTAPIANAMGLSVEDITTALSAMSMAGIKGSQAGTSLRTMLTRMVKPTDQVADAMDELGLVLTNSDGTFKSLDDIVAMMRNSFSGLTDEQKTYYATVLSGQEGMSGLLSLLNLTEEEYNKIADSMDNASGVAKETSEVMLNNLSGQVTLLKSALEGLAIQFGEILLPYLKSFIGWIQEITEKLQKLTPEQKEQVVRWAAIGVVIGPVLIVLGKLVTSIGGIITTFGKIPSMITSLKTSFGVLKTAVAGISGPVVAVIAVIAVLTAAFVSLWKNNEDFRNKITAIWEEIKATFDRLGQGIVERLNALGFDFENIGEVLKAIWQGFCDFLAPYFEGVFNYISIVFETFVNVFFGIWDFFQALFTGDWKGCWEAIKTIFISIWNGIKDWFVNIWNVFTGIWDTVLGWFGTSWDECWTGIKNFFVNTWNNIWGGLKTGAVNAWEGVKSVFSKVTTFFGDTFKAAWEKVKGVFTAGGKIFDGIKDSIVSVFKTVVNGLIDGINWVVKQPFQGLNNVLDRIANISILGATPFSWLTWRAPIPQIPYLAEGAVLPPNNPFLAVVGDQKRGVNVEAPLSTIQEAVMIVFNDFAKQFIELQRVAVGVLSETRDDVGYIAYHGFEKKDTNHGKSKSFGNNDNSGNGDTFNFYSPKALDEIEAAKQMKKAKRDLAEGY